MSCYGRISDADQLDRYYTPEWPTLLLLERLIGQGQTARACTSILYVGGQSKNPKSSRDSDLTPLTTGT